MNIKNLANIEGLAPTSSDFLSIVERLDTLDYSIVNGERVTGNGPEIQNLCPANGELLFSYRSAGPEVVDSAISSARDSYNSGVWRLTSPQERGNVLKRLADLILENSDILAAYDSLDVGKPWQSAKAVDVKAASTTFRWYGELCDKVYDSIAPTGGLDLLIRSPLGVIGAITPWNYPLMIAAWKLAPMLASGNSVVHKPAEQSPSSAVYLASLALECGIPPGVLNVVLGDGPNEGSRISSHNGIDAIGFTGSTETGTIVATEAAESNLKRVFLECGGKSPAIVMDDADIDSATSSICNGLYYMAGQSCNAPSRAIIHSSVYNDFARLLKEKSRDFTPENPFSGKARAGCIIEKRQLRWLREITNSNDSTSSIEFGGDILYPSSGGYYFEPTMMLEDDPSSIRIQKELFGPILVAEKYEEYEDMVDRANSTEFGLWANIFTTDLHKALDLASKIDVGSVGINKAFGGGIWTPMGGRKKSGYGKDRGIESMLQYTSIKHISI